MHSAGVVLLAVVVLLVHPPFNGVSSTKHPPLVERSHVLIAAPVVTPHIKDSLCAVAKVLIHRGHHVSMVTPYPPNFAHQNFTVIKISPNLKLLQNLNIFQLNASVLQDHTETVLEETIKTLLENRHEKRSQDKLDPSRYDAVIIPEFLNEIVYPFLNGFQGAFISFSSQGAEHYIVSNSPELKNPYLSVNPMMDAPYLGFYSLEDRITMCVFALKQVDLEHSKIYPPARKLLQTYTPRFKDLDDFLSRRRLSLLDGHRLLDGHPTRLQPGQVEVAGLALKEPQVLPQDLETQVRVRGSKGIVYVSLGGFTRSTSVPRHLKEALLEALGRLPYQVLWQYDGVDLETRDNVYKRKVMPQQDILGDKRTVLFITYCSKSATQQAVHHGVPVLALPVALDQEKNAKKLEALGVARIVDWQTTSADELFKTASDLIQDPSYSENVKRISSIMKYEKESPAMRAALWVEHSIFHHDDAPPLMPTSFSDLGVCDLELLATLAAGVSVIVLVIGVGLTLIFCCIYRCCRKVKPKKKAE